MRPITAAYTAPDTLGWLLCAYRAARRVRAPMWSVLTGSWARAFPWPAGAHTSGHCGFGYVSVVDMRAFVAAHYAYELYISGKPPRSLATWGFMQRVTMALPLMSFDVALLQGILSELFI